MPSCQAGEFAHEKSCKRVSQGARIHIREALSIDWFKAELGKNGSGSLVLKAGKG